MSINVPIYYDDQPRADDQMRNDRRRAPNRPLYRNIGRQQPTYFSLHRYPPDLFSEYPKSQHYEKPRFGERRFGKIAKSPMQKNSFDDEEKDHMGDLGGSGWDIPVHYVDKEGHDYHINKMPKRRSSDNGKNLQKSGKIGKVYDDGEENVIQQSNKKEKKNIRMFSQTSSTNDSSTSRSFPESSKAKREKTCDETVTADPPTKVTPRVSRQVSHCDPPTPAEIKTTRIKSIVERTNGFEQKIIDFADHTQSKNYLYISETLMKALLDLDTVDSEGLDTVRKSRKEAVDAVQALVDKLEEKLEENKLKSGEQSS